MEDATPTLLQNNYSRSKLVDSSSAFNTILPQQLVDRVQLLGVGTNTFNKVLDFFTERNQTVKVSSRTSTTITVGTESPQGCVLSPVIFSLLTHDCAANHHHTNCMIKFADDTTVVGLITSTDESS